MVPSSLSLIPSERPVRGRLGCTMDVVTWNVNSLRARLPRVLPWLEARRPEVVCLQETKVEDDKFPLEPLEELGYEVVFHGQKTYNGVAILSRVGIEDVIRGMGDGEEDERRVIAATVGGSLRVLNVYVVNGEAVGSPKYEHKLAWLERLHDFVDATYHPEEELVVCGDFNITFDDRDVLDPRAWRDKVLCSDPERDGLAQLMSCGLKDALRAHDESGGIYTWFDFRSRGFDRGAGLRIDHFLLSKSALERCTGVTVDLEERGREKPSDHAPVIAHLD